MINFSRVIQTLDGYFEVDEKGNLSYWHWSGQYSNYGERTGFAEWLLSDLSHDYIQVYVDKLRKKKINVNFFGRGV